MYFVMWMIKTILYMYQDVHIMYTYICVKTNAHCRIPELFAVPISLDNRSSTVSMLLYTNDDSERTSVHLSTVK